MFHLANLLALSPTSAAAEKEVKRLSVRIQAPPHAIDAGRGIAREEVFLWHPWPIRHLQEERIRERKREEVVNGDVIVRDGVELLVEASPEVLGAGEEVSIFVGLFSYSLTGSEASVEKWMEEGNLPPAHNPVRMWTLFTAQTGGQPVSPDELGDACIGEAFRVEICARVSSCFRARGGDGGGGKWRIAVPVAWATNYRVEVYLSHPSSQCSEHPRLNTEVDNYMPSQESLVWWAPPVAEHAVISRSAVASAAAYVSFRLLYVNQVTAWWGRQSQVEPVDSWTELMVACVQAGASSLAANPTQNLMPAKPYAKQGLWLEFGVGSGKTTAVIAYQLEKIYGKDGPTLHGFDSFKGLPTSWAHTKLGPGTFSTDGKVPEHLAAFSNVMVHIGLFSETLHDLEDGLLQGAPVAFAHVDVDLYTSAVEVLSSIACRLLPGSVLVFDELVNYKGFEVSGEFLAWEYIASTYQLRWEYGGLVWQQAVPVVILDRGQACG